MLFRERPSRSSSACTPARSRNVGNWREREKRTTTHYHSSCDQAQYYWREPSPAHYHSELWCTGTAVWCDTCGPCALDHKVGFHRVIQHTAASNQQSNWKWMLQPQRPPKPHVHTTFTDEEDAERIVRRTRRSGLEAKNRAWHMILRTKPTLWAHASSTMRVCDTCTTRHVNAESNGRGPCVRLNAGASHNEGNADILIIRLPLLALWGGGGVKKPRPLTEWHPNIC